MENSNSTATTLRALGVLSAGLKAFQELSPQSQEAVAERIVAGIVGARGPAKEPTPEQVRSACLSYRHDFGLLSVDERLMVEAEAREWLRAWQKEDVSGIA